MKKKKALKEFKALSKASLKANKTKRNFNPFNRKIYNVICEECSSHFFLTKREMKGQLKDYSVFFCKECLN